MLLYVLVGLHVWNLHNSRVILTMYREMIEWRFADLDIYALRGDFQLPDVSFDLNYLKKLPMDMVWNVLHRTPYTSKIRFSTVCKEWSSELLSPEQLRKNVTTGLPSPTPLLCLYVDSHSNHDPKDEDGEKGQFHRCLDQFKHYKLEGLDRFLPDPCHRNAFFLQEGILGYMVKNMENTDSQTTSLSIRLVNLMTRTWRDISIPTLSSVRFEDETQYENHATQINIWYLLSKLEPWRIHFRVLSISTEGPEFELTLVLPDLYAYDRGADSLIAIPGRTINQIHRYSSQADEWSIIHLHLSDVGSSVISDGIIYISRPKCLGPNGLLRLYSLRNGELLGYLNCQSLSSLPPEHEEYDIECKWNYEESRIHLTEHKGNLLIVSEVPTSIFGSPSLGIWKLNQSTMEFEPYTMLPIGVYKRLVIDVIESVDDGYRFGSYGQWKISTVGDYVCFPLTSLLFVTFCPGTDHTRKHMDNHLILCDMKTKDWQITYSPCYWHTNIFRPRLDIFL